MHLDLSLLGVCWAICRLLLLGFALELVIVGLDSLFNFQLLLPLRGQVSEHLLTKLDQRLRLNLECSLADESVVFLDHKVNFLC